MQKYSPQKKQIIQDYAKYFTPMRMRTMQHMGLDIVETKREGVTVTDIDGEVYYDCLAVGGIFNLGRRHPRIVKAIKDALEYSDLGNNFLISKPRLDLAKKLAETTPGDITCSFFGVSGSESNDLAIKLARGYTNRSEIISAHNCYHGCTGLSVSTSDAEEFKVFGPKLPGFKQVLFGNIDDFVQNVTKNTAAVIFEPMIIEAGFARPPKGFFKQAREHCNKVGTLMIIDEVVTGMGRTGTFWGIEREEIVPDIMVSAKGLSAGMYPISVMMFREELGDFFISNPFCHYSSFGGPELGCIVALEAINIINTPEFLNEVNRKGELFKNGFAMLKEKYSSIVDSYDQQGLMGAMRFKNEDSGMRLMHFLAKNKVFSLVSTHATNTMRFFPPLTITDEEISFIFDALDKSIPGIM